MKSESVPASAPPGDMQILHLHTICHSGVKGTCTLAFFLIIILFILVWPLPHCLYEGALRLPLNQALHCEILMKWSALLCHFKMTMLGWTKHKMTLLPEVWIVNSSSKNILEVKEIISNSSKILTGEWETFETSKLTDYLMGTLLWIAKCHWINLCKFILKCRVCTTAWKCCGSTLWWTHLICFDCGFADTFSSAAAPAQGSRLPIKGHWWSRTGWLSCQRRALAQAGWPHSLR